MATSTKRPGAMRQVAQLLVVVGGGVLIGALLVLLAFPDATPVGPPALLGGAGILTIVTAVLALRLGRAPAKPKKRAGTRTPAKRAAAKKAATRRKPAAKKRATSKKPTKKKPAKRTPAKRKPAKKARAAQGRSRR